MKRQVINFGWYGFLLHVFEDDEDPIPYPTIRMTGLFYAPPAGVYPNLEVLELYVLVGDDYHEQVFPSLRALSILVFFFRYAFFDSLRRLQLSGQAICNLLF